MLTAETRNKVKRGLFRTVAVGVATPVILILIHFLVLQLSGNFYVVADGALYRAAQPSEAALRRYVADWDIKTVVNLREDPASAAEDWEARIAQTLGVSYIHYPLPAHRLLQASEILGVLHVLATAQRPILVHSHYGSDRAGLIAALYLMRYEGKSQEEALAQLSPRFGHYPYLGSSTRAMDDTFEAVANVARVAPNTPPR